MNKKQQKTLKKIFAKPTRADIAWNEVKQKELKKYAVELVRDFLRNTGVKP